MSVESEMAVLGCVVLDGEFIKGCGKRPDPGDVHPRHHAARVFEAMVAQYRANGPVDGVTLVERLPDEKKILLQLAGYVPTTRHRFDYAKLCGMRGGDAASVPRRLRSRRTPPSARHRNRRAPAQSGSGTGRPHPRRRRQRRFLCSGGRSFPSMDERPQRARLPNRAIGPLDRATGGFCPAPSPFSRRAPAAARPTFALNLALHLARRKKKVLYCSMEMPDEQLMQRVASQLMHIDGTRIRDRLLSDEEKGDIERVLCQFRESTRIQFCVEPRLSVDRVRQCIELYQPDILFIDHIGLMERPSMWDAYRALGWVSNQLKQIALDTGLPIVELAQMNRQSDGRRDKRPRLADLRETGDLEQDADYVLFLWRDGEQPQGRLSGEAWTDIRFDVGEEPERPDGRFPVPLATAVSHIYGGGVKNMTDEWKALLDEARGRRKGWPSAPLGPLRVPEGQAAGDGVTSGGIPKRGTGDCGAARGLSGPVTWKGICLRSMDMEGKSEARRVLSRGAMQKRRPVQPPTREKAGRAARKSSQRGSAR